MRQPSYVLLTLALSVIVTNLAGADEFSKSKIKLEMTYTNMRTGTVSLTKSAPPIEGTMYVISGIYGPKCAFEIMGKTHENGCHFVMGDTVCTSFNLPALAKQLVTYAKDYNPPALIQHALNLISTTPYEPVSIDNPYYALNSGFCVTYYKKDMETVQFGGSPYGNKHHDSIHMFIKTSRFKEVGIGRPGS